MVRDSGENGDRMDDRLRMVEGGLVELQGWRETTVDPHIRKGEDFDAEVKEFIIAFKAAEKERMKLQDERHKENVTKIEKATSTASWGNLLLAAVLVVMTAILIWLAILSLRPSHAYLGSNSQTQSADTSTIPELRSK